MAFSSFSKNYIKERAEVVIKDIDEHRHQDIKKDIRTLVTRRQKINKWLPKFLKLKIDTPPIAKIYEESSSYFFNKHLFARQYETCCRIRDLCSVHSDDKFITLDSEDIHFLF